jgi:proteasome lid subunit RPN8/RPN11
MREREEQLLAIYHSHPRAIIPSPSETDVRLAYYPSATYLIVGLAGSNPVVKAFQISEREQRWQQVEYGIADE